MPWPFRWPCRCLALPLPGLAFAYAWPPGLAWPCLASPLPGLAFAHALPGLAFAWPCPSLRTIDTWPGLAFALARQVHLAVADHRVASHESREALHRYHPLVASLRATGRVRALVRVKPDGSGPLSEMCGCC